jgi:hypothetical protein
MHLDHSGSRSIPLTILEPSGRRCINNLPGDVQQRDPFALTYWPFFCFRFFWMWALGGRLSQLLSGQSGVAGLFRLVNLHYVFS